MTVAQLFIKCLESHGVRYIFGVPGEENLDMLDALKDSSIQFIITRNEQTAVFMAATHGRLTGKIGVALATLWPGATNMMTGVAYAQLWWMPVMVITGQKPVKKSKQGRFQVIDIVSMMKPITKFTTSLIDASRVASTVTHAIMMAEEEKPGAVHIELPEDVASEDATLYQPLQLLPVRRPIPDIKAVSQFFSLLESAERPMILIGGWANRKRISNYLTKVIEKYNIPFFTSQMGKGVVDERLSQYIGTAALTSGDYVHDIIAQADVIIAIGYDMIEKPTHLIEAGRTKVVHLHFTPTEITELYQPYLQIIWDIGNTLRQWYEATLDTTHRKLDPLWNLASQARQKLTHYTDPIGSSWLCHPVQIITELRSLVDDDAILCLDNGLYKVWFARNYPCYHPNTLLLDNALATMWAGYSSAMAVKLLEPDRQVIAIVGDGWVVMNLGDIETAVRLWHDLTIIILNDSAYGMIKRKQHNSGFVDYGLDLQNPNFVQLAESFGAKGYRVDHATDFASVFQQSQWEQWVKIIDVVFAYPDDIR